MAELETRHDQARPEDFTGVNQTCHIDRSMRSLLAYL